VRGLHRFDAGGPRRLRGVVLGYGTPPANGYDAAVDALAGALAEVCRGGRGARPAPDRAAPAPRRAQGARSAPLTAPRR